MTADEIRDLLYNDGQIDSGNDDAAKLAILYKLEELGYRIGFNKSESYLWRYIYYVNELNEIHMSRYDDQGKRTPVPADWVLSETDDKLYIDEDSANDWVDFFCCA